MKTFIISTIAAIAYTLLSATFAHAAAPADGRQADRQVAIDRHEDRQEKRINEGIAKGQLTPDEVAALSQQETTIQTLETSFKSVGKLTKPEAKQLKEALRTASLQIWAQRHDTEGNQKPVSRLGKDIIAKDSLTTQIESGDFTHAQARQFLHDFHQMISIKRQLSTENLTADQRTALTAQYNTLLNTYFQTK